jgi:SH3 domain-containing protein
MPKPRKHRLEPKIDEVRQIENLASEKSKPFARAKFNTSSHAEVNDAEQRQIYKSKISDAVEPALRKARREWEKETQIKLEEAAQQFAKAERERRIKLKVKLASNHQALLAEREAYWEAELARLMPAVDYVRFTEINTDASQDKNQSGAILPITLLLVFLGVSALYLFAPQWQPTVRTALQPLLEPAREATKKNVYRFAPWLMPTDIANGVLIDPNDKTTRKIPDSTVTFVNTTRVNLRAEPSLESKVLRILGKNTQVRPNRRKGDWIRVTSFGNKFGTGWIHHSFLSDGRPIEKP